MGSKNKVLLGLLVLGMGVIMFSIARQFMLFWSFYLTRVFGWIIALENICLKYNAYIIDHFSNYNTVFATMAAGILGIIAIAFSFAMFSIQYAAERGTSKILSEYKNDKYYIYSFVAIAIFAVLIFAFAMWPSSKIFTVPFFILSFLFLITTLILLFRLFRHTADLIDPRERINKSYARIKNYFLDLSQRIDQQSNVQ